MNKWNEFKESMKNPPPDRLAKIEWQSHLFQAIGILIVSIVLIIKGLWYVIFAFIFAIGISYSQGMNAYRKWKNIKEFMPQEKPKDFLNDISPTRKRGKIIEYVYGKKTKQITIFLSVIITYLIIGTNLPWWAMSLLYPPMMLIFFIIIYYIIFYKFAYVLYKKEMKK